MADYISYECVLLYFKDTQSRDLLLQFKIYIIVSKKEKMSELIKLNEFVVYWCLEMSIT